MAKTKISEFDSTPANNTDIDSINIAEGCAPSGINNAIRELMSQLKDQQTGASADNFTVGGNLVVTGTSVHTGATTFTGAVVMSTALPVASGGTGASTAGNARTNLSAAGSGANSDITSITGLTTALSAAQGGTGLTSPGTSGNFLTSNGSAWVSSALPAGSVLQVVSATKTDGFTTTSTSYVNITGMSVTITPKSATSKILIIANGMLAGPSGVTAFAQLVRGSTAIGLFGDTSVGTYYAAYWNPFTPDTDRAYANVVFNYLDSPATTSATTYKLQLYSSNGTSVAWGSRYASGSSLPAQGGTSTITVMEIAA
jgi:hypothetical protein